MGNTFSGPGGRSRVQSIIASAGLPLEIADGEVEEEDKPLSPFTEAYAARGWFTGVRSTVTIPRPPATVYASLAKDLHHVFTPMTECEDEVQEDDGSGGQKIFRVVRIPFRVAFVTGSLKLRLHVEQDSKSGEIHFKSAKAGRLIKRFTADFQILEDPDKPGQTVVRLDARIDAQSLPPPPFKGMVKDVMVRKMDACMVDLCDFHRPRPPPSAAPSASSLGGGKRRSFDLRAALRRSFDLKRGGRRGGRHSLDAAAAPLAPAKSEPTTQPAAAAQAQAPQFATAASYS